MIERLEQIKAAYIEQFGEYSEKGLIRLLAELREQIEKEFAQSYLSVLEPRDVLELIRLLDGKKEEGRDGGVDGAGSGSLPSDESNAPRKRGPRKIRPK